MTYPYALATQSGLKIGSKLYVNSQHKQYDCWTVTAFRTAEDGVEEVEASHNWSPSRHRWFRPDQYYTSREEWLKQFDEPDPEEAAIIEKINNLVFCDPDTDGVDLQL